MELPNKVSPSEHLARYLTQGDHFNSKRNSVKHSAFMPPADNLRLSVFRIDGLRRDEVWEIGQTKVVDVMPSPMKHLYGMADIMASLVERNRLRVDPDNNPSRHADVVDWPQDKSERKLIALGLAAEATLILRS